MTASEFGLWALAVFAWIFTAYGAVFFYAFVLDAVRQYWLDHQLRLRYLMKVDEGEADPFEDEEE